MLNRLASDSARTPVLARACAAFVLATAFVVGTSGCPGPVDSDAGTEDAGSAGEDAGTPETPPPQVGDTCDPFTFVQVCSDETPWNKLTCEAGTNVVVAEDCREAIDSTALTTCGTIPCLDTDGEACKDFRVTCLQPAENGRCQVRNRFTDGVPCAGDMGCIFAFGANGVEETCRPTTSCEYGEENTVCVGNIAKWCVYDLDRTITWQTAQGVDCPTFGGTCGTDPQLISVCQGDVGTLCNTVYSTSVFHCLPGLVCEGATAVSAGTCANP